MGITAMVDHNCYLAIIRMHAYVEPLCSSHIRTCTYMYDHSGYTSPSCFPVPSLHTIFDVPGAALERDTSGVPEKCWVFASTNINDCLKYCNRAFPLQKIYVELNDSDGVAGLAAVNVVDPTLAERILQYEISGKFVHMI